MDWPAEPAARVRQSRAGRAHECKRKYQEVRAWIDGRMVGAWRFELQTSCAQGRRATRLRYGPTCTARTILKHFPIVPKSFRPASNSPNIHLFSYLHGKISGAKMSTVLVTGGSGFIGAHCILQLLAAGHRVRTTVRNLNRESEVRAMLKRGGAEPGDQLSFFAADLEKD